MAKHQEENEEVEKKTPETEEVQVQEHDESEEFSLEPEQAKDDDDDDGGEAPEEERKRTRKERRAERGKIHEALANSQRDNQELRDRLARMEGYLTSQAQRAKDGAAPGKDPLESEIEDLERQGALILDAYNAKLAAKTLTQEELREMRARASEIQRKQRSAEMRLAIKQNMPQPDPRQEQAKSHQAAVYAMYPDVASNPAAFGYAQALWNARRLLPGAKQGNELLKEVMDDAREKYGLVKQSAKPTQNTREQFSGVSRGASAGQGNSMPTTFKPTKHDWAMADAAYSYIPDRKKRMQMYVDKVVKPTLQEKRGSH